MGQITIPLVMPKELLDEVRDAAKETGLSSADVMRQAIKFGVTKVRRTMSQSEASKAPKFKLVKENGYTVIDTDRTVSLEAIKEVLADFP